MDEIEFGDGCYCPKCGTETNSRSCSAFDCDDGFIDEYEDDAINYAPGEEYRPCSECYHGIERWCPAEGCGWRWRGEKLHTDEEVAHGL